MVMSYYDLGTSFLPNQEVQSAAANALQVQQERGLAVLPKVSLDASVKAALARRRAEQELAAGQERLNVGEKSLDIRGQAQGLEREKLAMRRDQYGHEQRMLPWEIGLSALGAGVNLYGGYRTLQAVDQSAADAQQRKDLLDTMYARDTVNTMRQVGLAESWRALLERQALPKMAPTVPDWGPGGP